jgi:hypothetical protein
MRKALLIGLVLAVAAIVALPIKLEVFGGKLSESATIVDLLKVFLPTAALVTALYTLYSKDNRLRANSENVLVSLIVFLFSCILLAIALLFANLTSGFSAVAGGFAWASLVVYAVAFVALVFLVFMRSYNEIYNLRTDKAWKYFKPIKKTLSILKPYKRYEVNVDCRTVQADSFQVFRPYFSDNEINQLANGASILLTGFPTNEKVNLTLDFVCERLSQGETLNYVSADRHPWEIWSLLKNRCTSLQDKQKDIVFIDAFSPSFAFTDDIHEERHQMLLADGVGYVKARHFAGLHTSVSRAFNIIKRNDADKGRRNRRPMVMVYANTSSLADFESTEQFRIFWRHVIPSERSYKMILIIIEDELVGEELLNPLVQRVDFILSYKRENDGSIRVVREK